MAMTGTLLGKRTQHSSKQHFLEHGGKAVATFQHYSPSFFCDTFPGEMRGSSGASLAGRALNLGLRECGSRLPPRSTRLGRGW